jgi:HAD superfamily hydrolase (TIGR01509 family)
MKEHRRYLAAIFDLDGLVLDTEIISRSAWRRAVADFGFVLDDQVYQKLIGLTIADAVKVFEDAFGADFPFNQANERRLQYIEEHIAEHGIAVKPGVVELLDFLDKIAMPKAIATSSSRAFAVRKLSLSGLIGRFDAVVCADGIQNGKPAPDIFLAAAKEMNIAPEKCLAFEDSENGVRAAHAAGMTVIMVPDLKQPSSEVKMLAHRVISSLHEAIPVFRGFIDEPA